MAGHGHASSRAARPFRGRLSLAGLAKSGLLGVCFAFCGALPAQAASVPSSPAGAGADAPRFSAQRLQRLDAFMSKATGADGYLGAVSLVFSDGNVVQSQAYGYRDLARSAPMHSDSIFRI